MAPKGEDEDLLDVRQAAVLAGRHPETVRRWIWAGRIPARRRGNRLVIARADLEAVAPRRRPPADLAAWIRRAEAALRESGGASAGRSAADLVLDDRRRRSGG